MVEDFQEEAEVDEARVEDQHVDEFDDEQEGEEEEEEEEAEKEKEEEDVGTLPLLNCAFS